MIRQYFYCADYIHDGQSKFAWGIKSWDVTKDSLDLLVKNDIAKTLKCNMVEISNLKVNSFNRV